MNFLLEKLVSPTSSEREVRQLVAELAAQLATIAAWEC
jgi:hypothetical protein